MEGRKGFSSYRNLGFQRHPWFQFSWEERHSSFYSVGNQCGLSADLCVLVCCAVCWATSLRTVKKATPLQYVCVPVCALTPACAQHIPTLVSAGVLVLDGLFIFPSYPNVAKLCSHHHTTLHWWTNLLVANSTGTELSFKDGHSAGLRCPRVPLSWLSLIWEAPALLCGCHEARAHITALLPSTPTIRRLRCPSAIRGVWRIEMLTSQKRTAEKAHRELRGRNFSDPGSYALPAEIAQIQTSTGGLGWNLRRHLSSMFTHDA